MVRRRSWYIRTLNPKPLNPTIRIVYIRTLNPLNPNTSFMWTGLSELRGARAAASPVCTPQRMPMWGLGCGLRFGLDLWGLRLRGLRFRAYRVWGLGLRV